MKIWSIDLKNIGTTKEVDEGYVINTLFETDVPMPSGLLIPAWDSKTKSWYDAGANVDGQLKPILGMVAQLIKQNVEYEERFAKLEEIHKQDTPLEGSAENVSE